MDEEELETIISKITSDQKVYDHVSLKGMMGMASFTEDNDLIKTEFKKLKQLFDRSNAQLSIVNCQLSILSMGMSADYSFAVEEGSTMVRVGSLLFGSRN